MGLNLNSKLFFILAAYLPIAYRSNKNGSIIAVLQRLQVKDGGFFDILCKETLLNHERKMAPCTSQLAFNTKTLTTEWIASTQHHCLIREILCEGNSNLTMFPSYVICSSPIIFEKIV